MFFKKYKLICISASFRILAASQNTFYHYEEAPHGQHNPTTPECEILQPHENEPWVYSLNNDQIIREYYNTEIPTHYNMGERHIIEYNQGQHELYLEGQLPRDEPNRQMKWVVNEQGINNPITSMDSSGEVLMMEASFDNNIHMPLGTSGHSYNPVPSQPSTDSLYEYSNSKFLYVLLNTPSPIITADTIRARFGGQFLSFLSSDQVVRMLCVLLTNKLKLSSEDQKEFIEMIFGHIDYSLELVITKDHVVMLVETIMKSNVSEYFEQVFLTWKLWYSFTNEEQEVILRGVYIKNSHKKEILVMLYLFVVNRDGNNSEQCKIFKNNIKGQYKEATIIEDGCKVEDLIIKGNNWMKKTIEVIFNKFDTCLLDLPETLKSMNEEDVILFRDYIRNFFFAKHPNSKPQYFKYKIHVCYALTKFTKEITQKTNDDTEAYNRLYFDPVYIKCAFNTWKRNLKINYRLRNKKAISKPKEEFINTFGAFRQIIQSNEYTPSMFFKLYNKVNLNASHDKPYLILLFISTRESILRELKNTPEWRMYIKDRLKLNHKHRYIGNFFMCNANPTPQLDLIYTIRTILIKIHKPFSKLNKKGNTTMHREHYFYQRLLFHPQFKAYRGLMIEYIQGLCMIDLLNNKERRVQIARDLVFSEYYHKAAVMVKNWSEFLGPGSEIEEFIKCLKRECELYENKDNIEEERRKFEMC